MIKTHPKSKIIQFHHDSTYARKVIATDTESSTIVLQIEPIDHKKFDFIAEVVSKKDYEQN